MVDDTYAFVCGVSEGDTKRLKCPCCGMESDNPELFGVSACWRCSFAMNWDCDTYRGMGVVTAIFDQPAGKAHLLHETEPKTRCGVPTEGHEWSGGLTRENCQKCFADRQGDRDG